MSWTARDQTMSKDIFLRSSGQLPDRFERRRQIEREKEEKRENMFLASIYRRDYLAPLTSAGYRRRMDDLHVWRVIPWMELAISSLNLPTWPAGPVKWTVGRRRRACSTRGNASYRLRLASFMHIHGRPAADARGRTGARARGRAHDYPIPPRSEKVYLRTYGECTQSRRIRGGPGARIPSFLALGSVTTSLTPVEPFSHRHHRTSCILGLYAVPCLREVVSDLISRLVPVEADPPWFNSHSCAYNRVRSVVFSWKLQQPRVERMRFDAGYLPGDTQGGDGIITRVSPQGRTCRRALSQKESSKIQPSLIADAGCALMTVDRVSLD